MKHGKHSKNNNNDIILSDSTDSTSVDISSSSKDISSRSDRDIYSSKRPKGRIVTDLIARILFGISVVTTVIFLAAFVTLGTYFTANGGLPKMFIIAAIVVVALIAVLCAVQIRLLTSKRKRHFKRKRIISIFISIVVILATVAGTCGVRYGQDKVVKLLEGGIWAEDGENENQVGKITKDPFLVYVSGIDTRNTDEIADKARSDVNMVVAVNPKQKRVLMVSVPRDYYVPLDGDTNKMDKLTHAGNYGVESSMKTLGSVFDVTFNYYVRVNFKSVYDIVNAVGEITVTSDYNFSSRYSYTGTTYTFVQGENVLNGDQALAFARERKSFSNGDRQRGIHQQKVIEAAAGKIASTEVLLNSKKLEDIVGAINENIKSNFSQSEVKALIGHEIDTISNKWEFISMSVDGSGGPYAPCHSLGNAYASVVYPDQDTVDAAKAAIEAVMNGEEIPADDEAASSSVN